MTREAPAKLNLRLLVGTRRTDGYHDIRSLIVALKGLSDTVHVVPAPQRSVTCPGVDGEANLAWAALDALERHLGRSLPCAVTIDKRIPAQAGLGGGSSDAAATLRAANDLFHLGLDDPAMETVAAAVGSDVPFFVRGVCQWARGRGDELTPAKCPDFAAVVAMPGFGLSTAAVYRRFDERPPPAAVADDAPPERFAGLARWVRNDLWDPAVALEPRLEALAHGLVAAGAEATLLCGSGAAIAGLVPDSASAATVQARFAIANPAIRTWAVTPST